MNNLPDHILDVIYNYKHQIEYRDVVKELTDCTLTIRIEIGRGNYDTWYLNINGIDVTIVNNVNDNFCGDDWGY